jgi:3-hydroxyisobutyrate dehydrogenase-like beta-hydroxyacid dehydrogenase
MAEPPVIALFGLGEAGALIAGDLVAAGARVAAFDPADVPTPRGVVRRRDPGTAVHGADIVMGLTAGGDAEQALMQAVDVIETGTLYADLATTSPSLERKLAAIAQARGFPYADVALMAPVPGSGLRTPSLASGAGAARYREVVGRLGGVVTVVEGGAGRASARKLMRSVVMKGLTAVVLESLEAGAAHGDGDWLWDHIVDTVTAADAGLLRRLLDGTTPHAERRLDEMRAAEAFLVELGVSPDMTHGTVGRLERVAAEGMPDISWR